jgi:sec-independent protein translocase protein TatA
MMGIESPLHIAFLLLVLLLVFGARRLPEMGRSLGSGMREFKQSIAGELSSGAPAADAQGTREGQRASAEGDG